MVENDYRHKKFLIVDDFESFQKILKRMLHGLNAKDIDTALSGGQAVARCQENRYDVIFCDYDLGKGPNGLQVLEELRHLDVLKQSAIFIMITAEAGRDAVVGSLEFKPDAYMSKPISSAELEARLVKCLKQKDALSNIYAALDDGDYQKVIKLCDERIAQNDRHKNWCLKTKGNILLKLARWAQAQQLYEDVLNERPLFWAKLGYAQCLAAQNLDEDALNAYQSAYKENPASLEAYEGAARMLIKQGDSRAAQRLLEQSTTISSRSVTRQKLLAEVCKLNEDFEGAARASRMVVKLAENSIHEDPENELDLADNLTEAARSSDEEEKTQAYAQEALDTLKKTSKKHDDQDVKIQSKLVESRAYASIDDNEKSQAALKSAEEKIGSFGDKTQLRTQLELAKSYLQTGHKEKGFNLLRELAEQYNHDPQISARLDKLVDEPISKSGKEGVVQVNKHGISMFEKGHYTRAVKYFLKATQHFPKHIGIRLNIIQALLFEMKKTGPNVERLSDCEFHLKAASHISEEHKQYKRFVSFQKTLATLQQHLSNQQDKNNP